MNPPCAFCKKTVYPTEKFNCLDKIWHKGCFKCTECHMKLTMNTYKGFSKMPYCNAHYPKLKATQVARTAEQERLKKISDQQSQVLYHKDFNEAKGSKISVTDDPAMATQKKASKQQSQVAYHGLAEKKAQQEMHRPAAEEEGSEPGYPRGYPAPADVLPPSQHERAQAPLPTPQYHEPEPEPEPQMQPAESATKSFSALYDYDAADDDEVSFKEGDILHGAIIDEGWLEGTIESSGQYGMAPRNYFEEL